MKTHPVSEPGKQVRPSDRNGRKQQPTSAAPALPLALQPSTVAHATDQPKNCNRQQPPSGTPRNIAKQTNRL